MLKQEWIKMNRRERKKMSKWIAGKNERKKKITNNIFRTHRKVSYEYYEQKKKKTRSKLTLKKQYVSKTINRSVSPMINEA